jgi:hypothetical protein
VAQQDVAEVPGEHRHGDRVQREQQVVGPLHARHVGEEVQVVADQLVQREGLVERHQREARGRPCEERPKARVAVRRPDQEERHQRHRRGCREHDRGHLVRVWLGFLGCVQRHAVEYAQLVHQPRVVRDDARAPALVRDLVQLRREQEQRPDRNESRYRNCDGDSQLG